MTSNRRFYWKAFISFSVLFTFAAIGTSGLVLYVAPPGRVANWSVWTLGALEKSHWQAVHTIFALLFLAAAVTHLIFNWRVLLAYLKMRVRTGVQRRRELATAAALTVGVLIATLVGVPPFSSVMTFGESVKNGWVTPESEAPVPHAEALAIAKLADTVRVPAATLIASLATSGVQATPETTLAELAARHGTTPMQMYTNATSGLPRTKAPVAEGGGYGQKTIEQVCRQVSVPLPEALSRLRDHGISAGAQDNVKEVATRHGKAPIDIVKTLAGE